jgi:sec-independent protein translocase protein TatB
VFENIGWGEILVLIIAGLFILGPERLPEAAAWLGRTIRQVREFATGARDQLNRELGPEFDEIRKPLQDLRGLRHFDPKRAVVSTLFNDDPPDLSGLADLPGLAGLSSVKPNGYAPWPGHPAVNQPPGGPSAVISPPPRLRPLDPGERPPIDPDAT